MANVAIDSEMASNLLISAGAGTQSVYSFTNTAGTLMLIGVVQSRSSGAGVQRPFACTSVSYAGVQATKLDSFRYDLYGAVDERTELSVWYIVNPATGANNIIVDCPLASVGFISGALTVTGACSPSQFAIQKSFRQLAGTSATVVMPATVLTSSMIVAFMATGNSYVSTAQTLSASKNVNSSTAGNNASWTRTAGTGADITMSNTVGSDWFAMIGIEIFGSITDTTYKARYSNRRIRRAAMFSRKIRR